MIKQPRELIQVIMSSFLSALSTASGKASNFSIDKIEDDLTKHKAVATVRWHAPHDVALDKRVTSYIFSAHGAGTTIPKSPIVRDGDYYVELVCALLTPNALTLTLT